MLSNSSSKNAGLNYPNFSYLPIQIHKFVEAAGIFTLLLKDGNIIHHVPDEVTNFKNWLLANNIPDVKMNWSAYSPLQ